MDPVRFWSIVSYLGDAQVWIGIAVFLLLVYLFSPKKTRTRISWILIVLFPAMLISYGIGALIKQMTMILRPCWGVVGCPLGYSFPSGHATVIFAFAMVFSFMMHKSSYTVFAFTIALLVAFSRVFLGYHTFFDIVGGALLGSLVGILFCAGYKSWRSSSENRVHKR